MNYLAINSCITIDVNDSINVFPPPVSCFTSSKVCHYDTTKFMSCDFPAIATNDTIICTPDTIFIDIPNGISIVPSTLNNFSTSMEYGKWPRWYLCKQY